MEICLKPAASLQLAKSLFQLAKESLQVETLLYQPEGIKNFRKRGLKPAASLQLAKWWFQPADKNAPVSVLGSPRLSLSVLKNCQELLSQQSET